MNQKKEDLFIIFLVTLMLGSLFFNILNRLSEQSNKAMFYYTRFKQVSHRNVELQKKWEQTRVRNYDLEAIINELKNK